MGNGESSYSRAESKSHHPSSHSIPALGNAVLGDIRKGVPDALLDVEYKLFIDGIFDEDIQRSKALDREVRGP